MADTSLNKLKVDIYVPLDSCVCTWDKFMNLVFSVLTPYIKFIDYDTKNLNSEEARALKLTSTCVIVDNNQKFTTSFHLKSKLPEILKEKGLLIDLN